MVIIFQVQVYTKGLCTKRKANMAMITFHIIIPTIITKPSEFSIKIVPHKVHWLLPLEILSLNLTIPWTTF